MTTRREFLLGSACAAVAVAAPTCGSVAATRARVAPVHHGAIRGTVETVLGPVSASELGYTLTHEHICKVPDGMFRTRAEALAEAVRRATAARLAGVGTIVDVTPFDVGRDVSFGAEVSRQAGIRIVACTGQHMFASDAYAARSVGEMVDVFTKEIEIGIGGTGIRAGIIKVATRQGDLSAREENVLRAAARTSRATGVPIQTHTNARLRGGEAQAAILESEGLDPTRVSLGHSDDSGDYDYLQGLAGRGYTLGMDHVFYGAKPGARLTTAQRLQMVKRLIDAGMGDRLFFSNDWTFGDRERDALNPDGMLYSVRRTVPALLAMGVSADHIRGITVENPARFFARRAAA